MLEIRLVLILANQTQVSHITGRFFTIWATREAQIICFHYSVTQSCLTFCNSMECSTPDFPVLLYLLELAQTHVRWVRDPIQPSHRLLSPSLPVFNHSQYQGLFQWVSSLHLVAKVLELQLQHQSFWWIFRTDIRSPRDSQEFSPTPQFKSISSSVLSFLYSPTLTSIHDHWKNHSLD